MPLYVPNLAMSDQTALHNHTHEPFVVVPIMYFTEAVLEMSEMAISGFKLSLTLREVKQEACRLSFSPTAYTSTV